MADQQNQNSDNGAGRASISTDLLCIAGRYRNKPCPCGSGKKAKKCCASASKWNDAKNAEREAQEAAFKAAADRRRKEGAEEKPRRRSVMPALLAISALGMMGDRRI